jgi:hypothetical protein
MSHCVVRQPWSSSPSRSRPGPRGHRPTQGLARERARQGGDDPILRASRKPRARKQRGQVGARVVSAIPDLRCSACLVPRGGPCSWSGAGRALLVASEAAGLFRGGSFSPRPGSRLAQAPRPRSSRARKNDTARSFWRPAPDWMRRSGLVFPSDGLITLDDVPDARADRRGVPYASAAWTRW